IFSGERTAVHAGAVDADSWVDHSGSSVLQLAGGCINRIYSHAAITAVAGRHQRDLRPSQWEVITQIHVVDLAIGQILHLCAVQVIYRQAASFICTQDQTHRWVGRMNPDGWVVGGIAAGWHRSRLYSGSDLSQLSSDR